MPTVPGYDIRTVVDEGPTAVLCRAVRSLDGQPFLVKLLRDDHPSLEDLARLEHEHRIALELDIDGVLPTRGLEKHEKGAALLFDDFAGEPLSQRIAAADLDIETCLRIASRLCLTLARLHDLNVIHKDIKPDNILVDRQTGEVRLFGFGVASRLRHEQQRLRRVDLLEGTLAYMSPEQTGRMNRRIDYRTDLYSLGVTLYEMLAGRLPFVGSDPIEILHAHVARQPVPVHEVRPEVPRPVSRIVDKLLAKTAEERYQKAEGLGADLDLCLERLAKGEDLNGFRPGGFDVGDRFRAPPRLYGREDEITELLDVFAAAARGTTQLLLVAGYSGIGKSSLVHELHRPVSRANGYFVTGKFDQLRRTRPYSALVQAFEELVHQLLAQSDAKIEAYKEKLVDALAPNAQIIIDLIPEVELVIGPQPAVPSLPPNEARNRFELVWQAFIQVFTTAENPLVVFLDDLQWVDPATLTLLERLAADPEGRHLLIVGAYRDNEVDAAHPLTLTLEDIEASGTTIRRLGVGPLLLEDLAQLIADALDDEVIGEPLAEIVFAKTEGNPFFVLEFLKLLVGDGLLSFDVRRGSWNADFDAIGRYPHADNVVELLVGRIQKLDDAPRRLLTVAACIGSTFDLGTLAILDRRSVAEMADDLRTLTRQELIDTTSDLGFRLFEVGIAEAVDLRDEQVPVCRFFHDRIQQAAYSLLDDQSRRAIHHDLGRLLLQHARDDAATLEEHLFDVVHHLNEGSGLIDTPDARDELLALNLDAAQKAKASAAYDAALSYLGAATSLLRPEPWLASYNYKFELALEEAECSYLCGRFEVAEAVCNEILANAASEEDRLQVQQLKITIYTGLSRYEDALAVGIEAAERLQIRLPTEPKTPHVLRQLAEAKLRVRGKPIEDLEELPPMTEPRQLALVDLLLSLVSPAFLSNETFAIVISLRMFNQSLRHGFSRGTPFSYMLYGIVNSGMGNVRTAGEFGRLALRLSDRLGDYELDHVLRFLFATAINHWEAPARANLDYLQQAYKGAVDRGDLVFADFSLITSIVNSFFVGEPLDRVATRCTQYFEFFERVRGNDDYMESLQGQGALMQRQHTRCLQGRTRDVTSFTDDDFEEDDFVRRVTGTTPLGMFNHVLPKMQMLFLFGQHAEGLRHAEEGSWAVEGLKVTADVRIPEYYFYQALLAAGAQDGDGRGHLRLLRKNEDLLRRWAASAPDNYAPRHLLVSAEAARIAGEAERAMRLYDESIAAARKSEQLQVEAIACERVGRFHRQAGRDAVARVYLGESSYAYARWGATTKVEALESEFPWLATVRPGATVADGVDETVSITSSGRLDLATVMKATEAISNELQLQSFLRTLLGIIMENAGAQRGFLVLEEDGELVVEATGALDGGGADADAIHTLDSLPLAEAPDLSQGVVAYVARTRQSVLLHDAANEGSFIDDPYVRDRQPKSILCSPLIYQGELSGIVYLENNLTSHAFTPERVEFIGLLSGQAAITLQNAKLFSHQVEMTASARRFVPHEFLKLMDRERLTQANLGDSVEVDVTILVSDIRSFTTLSEEMTPRQNFEFINRYLGDVGPIVRDHDGFIAKYTGDGMMALFPGAASDAIDAAIATLRHVAEDNLRREAAGEQAIKIGIGLHSGSAMLGIVGEEERMQCDAMSDAANLANRIEGLCKPYGASLLVSGQLLDGLPDPGAYRNRFLGRARVKGRRAPIRVYEICDGDPPGVCDAKMEAAADLEAGWALYSAADFDRAMAHFGAALEKNPGDAAAALFMERAAHMASRDVPAGWDGADPPAEG